MEATTLFAAVAALVLLAVTSMRFGVDSREAFASKERELASRGIVWSGSLASRERQTALPAPLNQNGTGQEQPSECFPAPCGA